MKKPPGFSREKKNFSFFFFFFPFLKIKNKKKKKRRFISYNELLAGKIFLLFLKD
jgi:hypothetical protein